MKTVLPGKDAHAFEKQKSRLFLIPTHKSLFCSWQGGFRQLESHTVKIQCATLTRDDGERVSPSQEKETFAFNVAFWGHGQGSPDFSLVFLYPFAVGIDKRADARFSHSQWSAHRQTAVAFDNERNSLPAGVYQPVDGNGHASIVTERHMERGREQVTGENASVGKGGKNTL